MDLIESSVFKAILSGVFDNIYEISFMDDNTIQFHHKNSIHYDRFSTEEFNENIESVLKNLIDFKMKFFNLNHDSLNIKENDIYKILLNNVPMTRNQLVKVLNYPRSTIYDNLAKLVTKGLIKKFPIQINERGRPFIFYTVIPKLND